jgi:hypothetical protein
MVDSSRRKRTLSSPQSASKYGSPAQKKAPSFSSGQPIFLAILAWSTVFRAPQPFTILLAMVAFFLGKYLSNPPLRAHSESARRLAGAESKRTEVQHRAPAQTERRESSDGLVRAFDQVTRAMRLAGPTRVHGPCELPESAGMNCRIWETQQSIWQPARPRPQGMPHQFFESFASSR